MARWVRPMTSPTDAVNHPPVQRRSGPLPPVPAKTPLAAGGFSGQSAGASCDPRVLLQRNRGFTLVEVLLVLAILGITTIVTMPYLVKSIRGNRLRVAANTVVRIGRYARTMAMLGNREMVLSFDIANAMVSIAPYRTITPPADEPPTALATPSATTGESPESPAPQASTPPINLSRKLDGVSIRSVELKDHSRKGEGPVAILYRSNGRCTPYEVMLVDERGAAMRITVDALSSAEAVREGP